jgi:3-hydroxyacyl-[acyl-carrier-protein] dehydratase
MIGIDEIKRILPHRYPMLLVDRVTEIVPGERLTALKAVTVNEPWYAGGDGGDAYPSVLVIESWCQAAGVLASWETRQPDVLSGQVMLFGSMADIHLQGRVLPGDVLTHRVRLVRSLTDAAVVEGESLVGDRTVLHVGRVVMALRPASVVLPGLGSEAGVAAAGGVARR